jgi:uncharacterized protein YbaP (TraB family)
MVYARCFEASILNLIRVIQWLDDPLKRIWVIKMYYMTQNQNLRFLASMHMIPAGTPALPQWALAAYEWADCFVFEAELGAEAFLQFKAQDGIGLEHKVSGAAHAALKQLWLAHPHLPELSSLHPWAAALLSGSVLSPMEPGVEPIFISWAAEDGKEVQYLEAPSSFPILAKEIPTQQINSTIETMLADLDAAGARQRGLCQAWLDGDMCVFHQVAQNSPLLQFPDIKRALLDCRNLAWANKLQELMGCTRKTLVAVGALHLCIPPTAQHLASIELQAAQ